MQDRELRRTQAHLAHAQQLTDSLEHRINLAQTKQQHISSELSNTQSQVLKLEHSLQTSQQQCTGLEQARSAMESEADRLNTQLVSVQSQLSEAKQHLAEMKQAESALKAQLQLTDQYKAESEKQLVSARTGISNLRVRLDEVETELRKHKVQSSLQACDIMARPDTFAYLYSHAVCQCWFQSTHMLHMTETRAAGYCTWHMLLALHSQTCSLLAMLQDSLQLAVMVPREHLCLLCCTNKSTK